MFVTPQTGLHKNSMAVYPILTVAFCLATKALSKSPTPWRLIGLANPLKISNIVLTLMKQSPDVSDTSIQKLQ